MTLLQECPSIISNSTSDNCIGKFFIGSDLSVLFYFGLMFVIMVIAYNYKNNI